MDNFLMIPYSILTIDELNVSSKIVLAEILSILRNAETCFASNEYFSKRTGFGCRTVANSINELRKKGYITSKRKNRLRLIEINRSKLKGKVISANITTENPPRINANSSRQSAILSDQNAKTAQYNNRYKNKYKNSYNNSNQNSSYDLEELMVIR